MRFMITRIGKRKPFRVYFRERREKLGLTQSQVAERMGTVTSKVSKLETGDQKWNDRWLAAAAYAFDIEVEDLFRDPDAPTQDELLAGLSPEDRLRVINLAERLKAS